MASQRNKLLTCLVVILYLSLLQPSVQAEIEKEEISRFRTYLQLVAVHPNPSYASSVEFLTRQGAECGLKVEQLQFVDGKPLLLMKWEGTNPSSPAVLLNSHMDVVPVEADKWTHPPFDAHKDEDGNIFARGSQDMKCVGLQYLEAVRVLVREGVRPQRTVYLLFVPDEEIGGKAGMVAFAGSEKFRSLKIGFALDEGLASPTPEYRVFYGERAPWWVVIKSRGAPGHGSKLFDNSAGENLMRTIGLIADFRRAQFDMVKAGVVADGEVVSINLSYLKAGTPTPTGFVMNLQPSEAEAGFDMRVPPMCDIVALERRIAEEWAPEWRNMSYKFLQKTRTRNDACEPLLTSTDESNEWWKIFSGAVARAGGALAKPEIFPAATDGRYLRLAGIPVLGFSPMMNTPVLLHDHNEFLNEEVYMKGISIYQEVIKSLSSIGTQGGSHSEL